MNSNRVNSVLVSNVGGANTGTSLASIIAGDVLVLNQNNSNLTGTPTPSSAAGNDAIRIALGLPAGLPDSDTGFRLSSLIRAKNVTSWKKATYVAPVEQVDKIGYNGTSGGLDLSDLTEYRLRIVLKDRNRFMPHRPTELDFYYTTGASASDIDAALAFARKINNDSRRLRNLIQASVVAGTTTLTELTANGTVINGSKIVTSTGHGFAVGEYISIRGILYKIAEVTNANTVVLDRPYTGVSETIAVASTVDQIASAASISQVGLNLTGQAITTKSVDLYQQLNFTSNLAPVNGKAGDEEAVLSTGATTGSGYWEQVKDMEFFEAGYRGITNRRLFPIDEFKPIAQVGATYQLYVIEHFEVVNTNMGLTKNPLSTVLAFDVSSASTKAAAVEAILDSWMAGAGVPAV